LLGELFGNQIPWKPHQILQSKLNNFFKPWTMNNCNRNGSTIQKWMDDTTQWTTDDRRQINEHLYMELTILLTDQQINVFATNTRMTT
jgi:hypothetical protein